jgi:squalene synthase HpnC
VAAIYWFARTADDIADEGDAPRQARMAELARFRNSLRTAAAGQLDGGWTEVFEPLARTLQQYALPLRPFEDLLDAFEQDCTPAPYTDRPMLLDYCRRSANPVGRLLLALYGVNDAQAMHRSDAICSALQLINFWQDAGMDLRRGRLYFPLSDLERHGISAESLQPGTDSAATRAMAADLCNWSRQMMLAGAPLALQLPGRIGWELRLVVQGGLRVLDRIAARGHDILSHRVTVGPRDLPAVLWRACAMRVPHPSPGLGTS